MWFFVVIVVFVVCSFPRANICRPYGAKNEKAAYRVPISRFFVHSFDNDSYFLPRYCEKFLCHHQIFVIEFIILYLSSLLNKNKKPAFEEQAIIF